MADLGSIPADTHMKCCRCQKGSLAEVTHVDITCGHNEPSNFFVLHIVSFRHFLIIFSITPFVLQYMRLAVSSNLADGVFIRV